MVSKNQRGWWSQTLIWQQKGKESVLLLSAFNSSDVPLVVIEKTLLNLQYLVPELSDYHAAPNYALKCEAKRYTVCKKF